MLKAGMVMYDALYGGASRDRRRFNIVEPRGVPLNEGPSHEQSGSRYSSPNFASWPAAMTTTHAGDFFPRP